LPLPGRLERANGRAGGAAMMVIAVASPRSMIFENGAVERGVTNEWHQCFIDW